MTARLDRIEKMLDKMSIDTQKQKEANDRRAEENEKIIKK